jgi:hypothetical protein
MATSKWLISVINPSFIILGKLKLHFQGLKFFLTYDQMTYIYLVHFQISHYIYHIFHNKFWKKMKGLD